MKCQVKSAAAACFAAFSTRSRLPVPDSEDPNSDEWTREWDARMEALKPILGEPGDIVFHATIPFQFRDAGGSADVVPFPNHVRGATYVTAELTGSDVGQRPSSLGHYELMICTKQDLDEAANFIARLACFTCDAVLEAGETMDIGNFFGDSSLTAMLFTHPGSQPVQFDVQGQRCGLLLCVGITAEELAFARAKGTGELLPLLEQHGVLPYTIPDRPSVPLPGGSSRLRKMFGR